MANAAQKRALNNYRQRLSEKGMARFEVLALDCDRDLLRSLAKRLAQNDGEAARLRAEVRRSVAGEPSRKGGILAALRQSPLVGVEFDVTRDVTTGRDIDL
jgi:transposase